MAESSEYHVEQRLSRRPILVVMLILAVVLPVYVVLVVRYHISTTTMPEIQRLKRNIESGNHLVAFKFNEEKYMDPALLAYLELLIMRYDTSSTSGGSAALRMENFAAGELTFVLEDGTALAFDGEIYTNPAGVTLVDVDRSFGWADANLHAVSSQSTPPLSFSNIVDQHRQERRVMESGEFKD